MIVKIKFQYLCNKDSFMPIFSQVTKAVAVLSWHGAGLGPTKFVLSVIVPGSTQNNFIVIWSCCGLEFIKEMKHFYGSTLIVAAVCVGMMQR